MEPLKGRSSETKIGNRNPFFFCYVLLSRIIREKLTVMDKVRIIGGKVQNDTFYHSSEGKPVQKRLKSK